MRRREGESVCENLMVKRSSMSLDMYENIKCNINIIDRTLKFNVAPLQRTGVLLVLLGHYH